MTGWRAQRGDPVARCILRGPAEGPEQRRIELRHTRERVVEDRDAVGDDAVGPAGSAMHLGITNVAA